MDNKEMVELVISGYPPVEDKPGYVYLNRHGSIIHIDLLKEALNRYFDGRSGMDNESIERIANEMHKDSSCVSFSFVRLTNGGK